MCNNGSDSFSRGGAVIYYASVFLYFWFFTTPVVSLIFGSYLYICINWLHLHFDEAFSSLRIANYKAFTRFHIKNNGDLEVFTLAVDKVKKARIIVPICFWRKKKNYYYIWLNAWNCVTCFFFGCIMFLPWCYSTKYFSKEVL